MYRAPVEAPYRRAGVEHVSAALGQELGCDEKTDCLSAQGVSGRACDLTQFLCLERLELDVGLPSKRAKVTRHWRGSSGEGT